MMRLLLAVWLLIPASLGAQVPPLRIQGRSQPVSVAVALHRGYPAYPIWALRSLGGRVQPTAAGARTVLFEDTLHFEAYSPYFTSAGRVQQLASPVYSEGGILYLPHQFFAEWLPARFPDRFRYDAGALQLLEQTSPPVPSDTTGSRGDAEARRSPSAPSRLRVTASGPGAERVVILDPGHGGRDPGKIGPNGVAEKKITLAVAMRLATALRERAYEVHLTRTTDTLIPLAERPRLANRWKAGRPATLLLSLHANAARHRAEGFETYFLSEARTEDERRVAEMENAAVAFEEKAENDGAPELELILKNLRNDYYLRASNDLAEVLQHRLDAVHPGPNRGVKQAGFRVLVGAFMPAALVEIAFISNPREAQLLSSVEFQKKLAQALAAAIEQFFSTHEHLWAADGTGGS